MNKKRFIRTGIILLFLSDLFFISCERIISVKDNLFTAEIVFDQNTIVLEKESVMKVEIKPLLMVSTTVYYFSYKLLEGEGYFTDKDKNKINENTKCLLGDANHLISEYNFVPTKVGPISIQLHFFDNKEQNYDQQINFTCDYFASDFSFDAYPLAESALVEEEVAVNFIITESEKDKEDESGDVTYSMKFETSSNGTFKFNGTEYVENQTISVQPGVFSGTYKGSSEADHDIVFTVTNDNHSPQSRTAEVSIVYSYYQSDFTFVAEAQEGSALVDTTVIIDFNLTEILKQDVNYSMVYENTESGEFVYDGTVYTPGQMIYIEPGQSQGYYTGNTDGDHGLTFTVTNDNVHPQSHSDNVVITYNWYQSDFNIIANPDLGILNVGDSVRIDFELTEYLKENVNYSMYFQSSGAGTFTYNGISYYASQIFNVQPGNFFGKYVGTNAQTHDITFVVTNDNHIPVSHEAEVSIIYQDTDFEIEIDPLNNTAYPNEYASYNFQIVGGGNTTTTACIQNMGPGTDGNYMINGINYQNDWCGLAPPANITGVSNNVLKIKKSSIGLQNFRLFVNKNGITNYVDISLNCEAPTFEISDMHLSAQYQWWDGSINVYSSISSSYILPTNFTYVYKIGSTTMGTDNFTDLILPQTKVKTIALNEGLGAGEKTVSVTITNEYGYSQTTTALLTITDPRPLASFDNIDLSYYVSGNNHFTRITAVIRGTPTEGQFCDAFRMEFWHPCQNNWQPVNFGPSTWTDLSNNVYSIITKDLVIYGSSGCYSYIKKIRIQVRDNDGRLSEWFVHDETKK